MSLLACDPGSVCVPHRAPGAWHPAWRAGTEPGRREGRKKDAAPGGGARWPRPRRACARSPVCLPAAEREAASGRRCCGLRGHLGTRALQASASPGHRTAGPLLGLDLATRARKRGRRVQAGLGWRGRLGCLLRIWGAQHLPPALPHRHPFLVRAQRQVQTAWNPPRGEGAQGGSPSPLHPLWVEFWFFFL